jgi:hypothetical protein
MWIAVIVLLLGFLLSSCDRGEPVTPDEKPDTTSHNFTWQVERLGDGGSSAFYDVAIVNDTLAYAVGEVYQRDSTGAVDPIMYNVARWNGRHWSTQRLYYRYPSINPVHSIIAFHADDIWFGIGSMIHWDGVRYVEVEIPISIFPSIAKRMWGNSPADLYVVGNKGLMVHFDGSRWSPVPSGTTLPIQDIWGNRSASTGETEILAVAGDPYDSYDRRILKISGTNVTTLSDSGIAYTLKGTWFSATGEYWVVGDGIYHKARSLNAPRWEGGPNTITPYLTNAIRGTAANDLFVVGALGELLHFNGSTWVSYRDQTGVTTGQYYSVAFRGNLVVAVGYESSHAIVTIGRRQ